MQPMGRNHAESGEGQWYHNTKRQGWLGMAWGLGRRHRAAGTETAEPSYVSRPRGLALPLRAPRALCRPARPPITFKRRLARSAGIGLSAARRLLADGHPRWGPAESAPARHRPPPPGSSAVGSLVSLRPGGRRSDCDGESAVHATTRSYTQRKRHSSDESGDGDGVDPSSRSTAAARPRQSHDAQPRFAGDGPPAPGGRQLTTRVPRHGAADAATSCAGRRRRCLRPVGVRLRLAVLAPGFRLQPLRHWLRTGLRPQVLARQHDTSRHRGPGEYRLKPNLSFRFSWPFHVGSVGSQVKRFSFLPLTIFSPCQLNDSWAVSAMPWRASSERLWKPG